MLKYSPDFTVSAKKSKSKGLDAVSQIQSITGKRAEKNFEPMQQNWFPLISSLARWCDRRGLLAHSPSFVSWIRPWTYRQWMEKQQLRRAAEPLVGLWILGISCLPCGVCSIEIHFLSGTWDTSHIRLPVASLHMPQLHSQPIPTISILLVTSNFRTCSRPVVVECRVTIVAAAAVEGTTVLNPWIAGPSLSPKTCDGCHSVQLQSIPELLSYNGSDIKSDAEFDIE